MGSGLRPPAPEGWALRCEPPAVACGSAALTRTAAPGEAEQGARRELLAPCQGDTAQKTRRAAVSGAVPEAPRRRGRPGRQQEGPVSDQ